MHPSTKYDDEETIYNYVTKYPSIIFFGLFLLLHAQLIPWVPRENELCVYKGLNFSSGRILKSTCPVQTLPTGPASTHMQVFPLSVFTRK